MARKKKGWNGQPIVYSSISEPSRVGSRLVRMSLYPIVDSERMGMGPKFDKPVLWDFDYSFDSFYVSCRCEREEEYEDELASVRRRGSYADDPVGWLLALEKV